MHRWIESNCLSWIAQLYSARTPAFAHLLHRCLCQASNRFVTGLALSSRSVASAFHYWFTGNSYSCIFWHFLTGCCRVCIWLSKWIESWCFDACHAFPFQKLSSSSIRPTTLLIHDFWCCPVWAAGAGGPITILPVCSSLLFSVLQLFIP